MRMTEDELAAFEERSRKWKSPVAEPVDDVPDPGLERDLQKRIEDYCDDHAYPWFHDRSRKVNEPGFPDLVIALPAGRTLWLELKSKNGRMSEEQKQWRMMLMHLGHCHGVPKSFRAFLRIVSELNGVSK